MKRLVESVEEWLIKNGQMFVRLDRIFGPNFFVSIESLILSGGKKFQTEVVVLRCYRKSDRYPNGFAEIVDPIPDELRERILAKLSANSFRQPKCGQERLRVIGQNPDEVIRQYRHDGVIASTEELEALQMIFGDGPIPAGLSVRDVLTLLWLFVFYKKNKKVLRTMILPKELTQLPQFPLARSQVLKDMVFAAVTRVAVAKKKPGI